MTESLIQRILVPTDLSDFSRGAVAWADLFRRTFGSNLTFLFANEPYVPVDVIDATAALAARNEATRESVERELRRFVAEHLPQAAPEVRTIVMDDTPSRAIVAAAKASDADLIVMGTHGRTGWRRAFLGSVTEAVIHHSDRRVVSIPPLTGTAQVRTIVCPVNFTDIGRFALEEAAMVAEAFMADLLIVYVASITDEPWMDSLERELVAWVEPGIRSRCRYSHIISRGDAAEKVLEIADQAKADMIVIGAQHKRFTDVSVIGTTTERVARFARHPVWTVPSPIRPHSADVRRTRELVAQ